MAITSSVGSANGTEAFVVGVAAYKEALKGLGAETPTFGFVFSSVAYDQALVLKGVRSVSRDLPMIGCSTSGEISTKGPLPEHSVVVMLISSDDELTLTPGIGFGIKAGENEAGLSLARSVTSKVPKEQLKSFIMLADGLAGNGAEIVRGIISELGEHFPLVGGSAGDDFQFKQTYQYFNDEVHSDTVVGVGLSGKFSFGIGVKHGWGVLGLPSRVTKSTSNIIHEIDGKPAISLYEKYFGDKAKELHEETLATLAVSYPLGIRVEGQEEYLIRDPLSVDENGSITCAAEIPEGSDVRIMMGTREAAIEMARHAAEEARVQLGAARPKAILIFNCIARKKLLGADGGHEIEAIQKVLGEDVPLIGFYTYGEQAPLEGTARNIERCNTVFHNETVVIFVIGG